MPKFASIKVGELVTLVIPLTVKSTGLPYSLSGQTAIKLRFKKRDSAAAAFEKTGAVSGDESLGLVAYQIEAADWTDSPALSAGNWEVLAQVEKGSSVKRFGPSEGTLLLRIESALT